MHCTVTHHSVSQGTGYALWQDCSGEEGRREDEWIAYDKQQAEKQERDLAKEVIDLGSSARSPEEHMACDAESGGGSGGANKRVTAVMPLGVGNPLIPELTNIELSKYLAKEKRLFLTGSLDDNLEFPDAYNGFQNISGYLSEQTTFGPKCMSLLSIVGVAVAGACWCCALILCVMICACL